MTIAPVKIKKRILKPHKATIAPILGARNVLTNEPWTFVSLWLKRQKQDDALFYWTQSYEFYKASHGLSLQSSPLVLYYSYLNAAKSLLITKGIPFHEHHGVRRHVRRNSRMISIANEGVRIHTCGVIPALSYYYRETETSREHSLQELFFNMAFIHRTYCLTYTSQTEMFIPLRNCAYMADRVNKCAFFSAKLSSDFVSRQTIARLPNSLKSYPELGPSQIKSVASIPCTKPGKPTSDDIRNLIALHSQLRKDIHYINGTETLWYAKGNAAGPLRLARQPPTLILAAMHRLSELCRYRPMELTSFLSGQKNWLIHEFVQMSPSQFIDEIAAEITGHQCLVPNVRSPS